MSTDVQNKDASNPTPQIPPEIINRMLDNQAREIDMKEKDITARQKQDQRSYDYAQKIP